ncbi:MAG TPA: class I SAM-dependent methyltransferase [Candidatus Bathyarchaeia archaeon]|nr:class I SAM-dependent methyltransferase [Candidatus Bathyarchaeia archaeon]
MLRPLTSPEQITGLSRETWERVVKAIEDAIPLYDHVNDLISFGKAQKARLYAIQHLRLSQNDYVLDGGIGPGTTSRLILSNFKPALLVGLDESVKQLRTAKQNLQGTGGNSVNVVRGSFESLPFRDRTFQSVITCYALRDSLDISRSVSEYSRVCDSNAAFADVDIGKPDNYLRRLFSEAYVKYLMPLIAHMAIRGKMKGNPWRMIGPTYASLPTNHVLLDLFKQVFHEAQLKEFLNGGVIVITGRTELRS